MAVSRSRGVAVRRAGLRVFDMGSRALPVLALVIAGARPSVLIAQERLGSWTVEYVTTALKVETVAEVALGPQQPAARQVQILLRNVSGRTITALSVSFNPEVRRSVDLAPWDAIASNATYTLTQTYEPTSPSVRTLGVAAVLFGDAGSAEGDQTAIDSLKFTRLGRLVESRRFLKALDALNPQGLDNGVLQATLNDVARLPTAPDDIIASFGEASPVTPAAGSASSREFRHAFPSAVRFARGRFRSFLTNLQGLPDEERAKRFAQFRDALDAQTTALSSFCQRDLGMH
jgi:hypothetical protein